MDIRKIIQEELRKVLEGVGSDYYNRFPDFIDTQFNPQMGKYPPKGMHAYGQVFKEDELDEKIELKNISDDDEYWDRVKIIAKNKLGEEVGYAILDMAISPESEFAYMDDEHKYTDDEIENHFPEDFAAKLEHLEVYPKFRKRGYAKELMDAVVKYVKSRDYKTLFLIAAPIGVEPKISLDDLSKFYSGYGLEVVKDFGNAHDMVAQLREGYLEEDYPEMFKMNEFKTLTTFQERIRYCEAFLQRISSGSSRIVYKIDDRMVLKLAKNKKGIAQNELEAESSKYADLDGLIAKVHGYDEDFLWVEMELARKMSKGDFERITGFSFDDYSRAVHNHGTDTVSPRTAKVEGPSKEMVGLMWEDDFISSIFQYMPDYDVPAGDLMRTSSYGIVNRDWGEDIVLVDYGFNKDIHTNYYS